jgi:hypothetical protein
MKILIAAGADVNQAMLAVDSEKAKALDCGYNYSVGSRTPLMYAAWFSSAPAINLLLEHGASKTDVDSNGEIALKYLAKNKVLKAAEKPALAKNSDNEQSYEKVPLSAANRISEIVKDLHTGGRATRILIFAQQATLALRWRSCHYRKS